MGVRTWRFFHRNDGTTIYQDNDVERNLPLWERINDLESRRENGTLKLGRPSNSESNRQKRIAERQYKIENGIAIKRGRPKVKKDEAAENKEA